MNTVLQQLPVVDLHEHPDNPRKTFAEAALSELVASIREVGVLTPLLVRPLNGLGGYQVLAGARRLRAAKVAGRMARGKRGE